MSLDLAAASLLVCSVVLAAMMRTVSDLWHLLMTSTAARTPQWRTNFPPSHRVGIINFVTYYRSMVSLSKQQIEKPLAWLSQL